MNHELIRGLEFSKILACLKGESLYTPYSYNLYYDVETLKMGVYQIFL